MSLVGEEIRQENKVQGHDCDKNGMDSGNTSAKNQIFNW